MVGVFVTFLTCHNEKSNQNFQKSKPLSREEINCKMFKSKGEYHKVSATEP